MSAYPPGRQAVRDRRDQAAAGEGNPLEGEIISPLRPQVAVRSPAEQYAELMGCSLAEAEEAMAPQLEGRAQSPAVEAAE